VVIVLNSFVTHWFAGRGTQWSSTLVEFLAMSAINFGTATIYIFVTPGDRAVGAPALIFLTLILTLIVTLYDHYRPIHDYQLARQRPAPGVAPPGPAILATDPTNRPSRLALRPRFAAGGRPASRHRGPSRSRT